MDAPYLYLPEVFSCGNTKSVLSEFQIIDEYLFVIGPFYVANDCRKLLNSQTHYICLYFLNIFPKQKGIIFFM